MKGIRFTLLTAVFLLILLFLGRHIYKIYHAKKHDEITCSAQYHIIYDHNELRLSISLDIYDSVGRMILSGSGFSADSAASTFNRSITFDVGKNGDIYTFNNSTVQILPKDNISDDQLKPLMSPFFYKNNTTLNLKIYPQNNRDFVVLFGRTPAFYCSYYD